MYSINWVFQNRSITGWSVKESSGRGSWASGTIITCRIYTSNWKKAGGRGGYSELSKRGLFGSFLIFREPANTRSFTSVWFGRGSGTLWLSFGSAPTQLGDMFDAPSGELRQLFDLASTPSRAAPEQYPNSSRGCVEAVCNLCRIPPEGNPITTQRTAEHLPIC